VQLLFYLITSTNVVSDQTSQSRLKLYNLFNQQKVMLWRFLYPLSYPVDDEVASIVKDHHVTTNVDDQGDMSMESVQEQGASKTVSNKIIRQA